MYTMYGKTKKDGQDKGNARCQTLQVGALILRQPIMS